MSYWMKPVKPQGVVHGITCKKCKPKTMMLIIKPPHPRLQLTLYTAKYIFCICIALKLLLCKHKLVKHPFGRSDVSVARSYHMNS